MRAAGVWGDAFLQIDQHQRCRARVKLVHGFGSIWFGAERQHEACPKRQGESKCVIAAPFRQASYTSWRRPGKITM
jgi:hypothetical protein